MSSEFSFSTSWNSFRHTGGLDLIKEIKCIGFDTVELNFSLSEDMVKEILVMKERSEIKISSLHNMCPLPKEIDQDEASPDYYSLASSDEEERGLAVEVAKNTISYAKKLGAKAVVLHAGRVQTKDRTKDLAQVFDDKARYKSLKDQMVRERSEKKGPYLNHIMKSLGDLVAYSKKTGVAMGIENRYYYREIPLIDELDEIFRTFKAGDIFYWHDVGHAEVFERLGLARHRDFLERFAGRLIGIHLHDIIGLTGDHNAPGMGTFDFSILKPYLSKDTIKVIEIHNQATADDVKRGLEHISRILA